MERQHWDGRGEENTEVLRALGQCIEEEQHNVQLSRQRIYDNISTHCWGAEEED